MSQNKPQTENALLAGPVRPALLRFAGPIILTMVATQLYAVADTMIVGLCLDAGALAAVSNASTVLMVFLFVSGGMELGGGLLLAARRPTAAPEELSAAVYNLLAIDAVLGLCMAGAGLAGAEWLLRLIRTPAEILPQAAEYIRFYLAGLPFLMVYDLSKQLVMACGNSKTPLYAVLATSVLNVLLDLAWVGPFGVAGAAAATALSQVAGCLFMLWYLRRTLLTGPFRFSMLDRRCLGEVFRLAAPSAIQQASAPVTSMVKQGLLGGIGVAAIAGFSCANKMSSLLLMPVYGFTQSLVFFIAQNTAARQDARVREGVRQARGIMLLYGAGGDGRLHPVRPAHAAALHQRRRRHRLWCAAAQPPGHRLRFHRHEALPGGQPAGPPADGAVPGLQPGGHRPRPAGLRPAGAPVGVQRLLPRQFRQRAGRLFAGGGAGPRRGPAGRGLTDARFLFSLPVPKGRLPLCMIPARAAAPLGRFGS